MPKSLNVLSMAVFLSVAPVAAQRQKPVVEVPVIGDFYDVPRTLEGFVEQAHAAAIVHVQRAVDAQVGRASRTTYRVEVTVILKPHEQLGSIVQVCRGIGSVEQADRIVRRYEPHFPAFTVGTDYLLFLRWSPDSTCFWPMFGAPSAAMFDETGHLKPFTPHPALQPLRGLDRDNVAAKVAAVRR